MKESFKKILVVYTAITVSLISFALPFSAIASTSSYYTNVSGSKVHVPVQAQIIPKGATARCRDGGYSYSQHRRGTCSYHGGVRTWLY
jgi:hypothetical protein